MKNFFAAALSSDALKNNIFTLRENYEKRPDYPVFETSGKMSEKMLHDIMPDEKSFWWNVRRFVVEHFKSKKSPDGHIEELKKIVEICREKNIELRVIILPVHAAELNAFAIYKNDIENIFEKIVAVTPVKMYMGYDEISGDKNNFWDAVHARKSVGDKILE